MKPERGNELKRYGLWTALKIVLSMETQKGRATVFQEIVNNNRKIRLVVAIYDGLRSPSLQAILIFLYGLKCILAIRPPEREGCQILATGFFPNEVKALGEAEHLLEGMAFGRFTAGWSDLTSMQTYRGARVVAARTPQLLRICRRLARRYSFMPACRGFSTLMYAIFYRRHVRDAASRAVVIASSYSPDAMGMAAAAHRENRQVIHLSHAFTARNADYIAPVYADLSVLPSPVVVETYRKKSHLQGEVHFDGIPARPQPLRICPLRDRARDLSVGVFLTGAVDAQRLGELVTRISAVLRPVRILLRPHPVSLLDINLDHLAATIPGLEVSNKLPIDAHAQLCSFVVCGNSSATLEVLKSGTPVLYHSQLDKLPHDYCGFLGDGLIPEAAVIEECVVQQLVAFYQRPEWTSVMMQYDPFYSRDPEAVRADLRAAVLSWLDTTGVSREQATPRA